MTFKCDLQIITTLIPANKLCIETIDNGFKSLHLFYFMKIGESECFTKNKVQESKKPTNVTIVYKILCDKGSKKVKLKRY